jgi:hypothetical protein
MRLVAALSVFMALAAGVIAAHEQAWLTTCTGAIGPAGLAHSGGIGGCSVVPIDVWDPARGLATALLVFDVAGVILWVAWVRLAATAGDLRER